MGFGSFLKKASGLAALQKVAGFGKKIAGKVSGKVRTLPGVKQGEGLLKKAPGGGKLLGVVTGGASDAPSKPKRKMYDTGDSDQPSTSVGDMGAERRIGGRREMER